MKFKFVIFNNHTILFVVKNYKIIKIAKVYLQFFKKYTSCVFTTNKLYIIIIIVKIFVFT